MGIRQRLYRHRRRKIRKLAAPNKKKCLRPCGRRLTEYGPLAQRIEWRSPKALIGVRFPDGSPYSKEGWVYPILLCCHDKVGIGESNPGGHERQSGAPVKLRTASGPKATERGAKEEACERSEAGGQSPMGHHVAADCAVFKTGLKCRFFHALRRCSFPQKACAFRGPHGFIPSFFAVMIKWASGNRTREGMSWRSIRVQ